MEAVNEFLPRHPEFEVDAAREKYMVTHNPRGFLRRKR
jgi:cephalosporin hydroxylase